VLEAAKRKKSPAIAYIKTFLEDYHGLGERKWKVIEALEAKE
jgi:hypothetical protein